MFYKLFLLLLLSVFLVACGGGGGNDNSGPPQTPPGDTPPDPDPSPEPPVLAVNCATEHADTANKSIALPPLSEGPMPGHSGTMMTEHMAALNLVDYAQATHVAVSNGDWCDPSTWHNDQVPGTDARAVIPEALTVTYASISDADLKTLRIDGTLQFSPTATSYLLADTIFVDPRGELNIGSEAKPIEDDQRVVIGFSNRGSIDTDWDPLLLSRGLIAHGRTTIHGAEKTPHVKVKEDPAAGDDIIVLSESPENWKPGDQLLIAGTYYSGWRWDPSSEKQTYRGTQDELRTITQINGNLITLSAPLEYNHFTPRDDLHTSVVNLTRNIAFHSENADDLPSSQRGHVMFMHSDLVDVRYAAFLQLGRTDKSVPSFEVHQLDSVSATSNIRGRYPFHFHRTGLDNTRNPALAIGNVVFNSPGWGFVHHDSHANFYENASFDTFGAGFISETGNETGDWIKNIAIKATGTEDFNPKNSFKIETYDIARSGEGFWFQSRMVRSFENIAASVNHGFVYFHRGDGIIKFPAHQYMLPEALGYGGLATPDDVPIRTFDNNEAFAAQVGLFVVKANPLQEHDIYTVLSNFLAWEVEAGTVVEYTSHYLFDSFDLIGNTPEQYRDPIVGIELAQNSSDMVIRNSRISGFPDGIHLDKRHTQEDMVGTDQYVLIDNEISGATTNYVEADTSDTFISGADLVSNRFEILLNNNEPFEYLDPSTESGAGVQYTGSKKDSIGSNPLPAGPDRLGTSAADMIGHLEQEGYYKTDGGEYYTIVEQYFSDRATGRIHKYGLTTRLGANVVEFINRPDSTWGSARFMGTINLGSRAPVPEDDVAHTSFQQDVKVDLLSNDTDPDGDQLRIDGIVQPRHGTVFDNGDGTILYRPNLGFSGEDVVQFWVSDGQGNFVESKLTVHVAGN